MYDTRYDTSDDRSDGHWSRNEAWEIYVLREPMGCYTCRIHHKNGAAIPRISSSLVEIVEIEIRRSRHGVVIDAKFV